MIVKLYDLFHTDTLRHRETAKKVVAIIERDRSSKAVIDFSKIQFASRSFLHELLCGIAARNVAFAHMNPEIAQMIQVIKRDAVPLAC